MLAPAMGSVVVLELRPDVDQHPVTVDFYGKPRHLDGRRHSQGTSGHVEAPAVGAAGDVAAANRASAEGGTLVGAGIFEGMDGPLHIEQGHVLAIDAWGASGTGPYLLHCTDIHITHCLAPTSMFYGTHPTVGPPPFPPSKTGGHQHTTWPCLNPPATSLGAAAQARCSAQDGGEGRVPTDI